MRKARALNVPVIRIPIDPMNVPWMVFQGLIWKILDALPFNYPDFIRLCRWGWHVHEHSNLHVKLGPAFVMVTPVSFYLHVADPEAVHDLLWRRKDFLRPVREYRKFKLLAGVGGELVDAIIRCLTKEYRNPRRIRPLHLHRWFRRLGAASKDSSSPLQRVHDVLSLERDHPSKQSNDPLMDSNITQWNPKHAKRRQNALAQRPCLYRSQEILPVQELRRPCSPRPDRSR